jgi:iron complex transport system ATP-binding protein
LPTSSTGLAAHHRARRERLPISSQRSRTAIGGQLRARVITAAVLALEQVDFGYNGAPVVRQVTITVAPGQLVCAVGKNGAGKSTLLRLAAGVLVPAAGRIACFGLDPARADRRQLATRMAYLPQEYQLAFPFTVAEVVLMGRYPYHRPGLFGLDRPEDITRARDAMVRCDVLAYADRRFSEISGGERRRALLAQAFCQNTELILLDEPTASLDPAHAIAVFEALASETNQRQAAVLVVTHDLNLASRFADRLVVLDAGRIVGDGPPATVLAAPSTAAAFSCQLHVGTLPEGGPRFVIPH